MKIVVLEADSVGRDVSWAALGEFGDVELYESTPNSEIPERIKDADIVIPNKCLLNEETLKGADNVKLISEAATGYNNIDIDYCKSHNIAVTNVGGYSTDSVAQHTFALLLSLADKLDYYTTYVEDGDYSLGTSFSNVSRPFHQLSGEVFGVVGLGKIGRKVAEIATAFGMKVIYYSDSDSTYDVPYEKVSFDELLEKSDVIGVHAPLRDSNFHLFDREAFKKMKRSSILINVARGPIVEEEALFWALENGEIQAAGLDVYESEPLPKSSKLLTYMNRDRLIMTPHAAWGSVEARTLLIEEICENIRSFVNGGDRSRIC